MSTRTHNAGEREEDSLVTTRGAALKVNTADGRQIVADTVGRRDGKLHIMGDGDGFVTLDEDDWTGIILEPEPSRSVIDSLRETVKLSYRKLTSVNNRDDPRRSNQEVQDKCDST